MLKMFTADWILVMSAMLTLFLHFKFSFRDLPDADYVFTRKTLKEHFNVAVFPQTQLIETFKVLIKKRKLLPNLVCLLIYSFEALNMVKIIKTIQCENERIREPQRDLLLSVFPVIFCGKQFL
jgi:hypothetical protein